MISVIVFLFFCKFSTLDGLYGLWAEEWRREETGTGRDGTGRSGKGQGRAGKSGKEREDSTTTFFTISTALNRQEVDGKIKEEMEKDGKGVGRDGEEWKRTGKRTGRNGRSPHVSHPRVS